MAGSDSTSDGAATPEAPRREVPAGLGCLFRMGILAAIGGILLWWPYHDDRGLAWQRRHLQVLQGQLQDLAWHLREFKRVRGQYPNMDQGLAALDNFNARFQLIYYRGLAGPESAYEIENPFACDRFWWRHGQQALREYRQKHGGPPRNAQQFLGVGLGGVFYVDGSFGETFDPVRLDVAIGHDDNFFVLSPAGVLSPWLVPYVYENRIGRDAKAFRGSPADRDRQRRWSVQVDEGVFVFAVGGEEVAGEYDAAWWGRHGPKMFGALLIAVSLGAGLASLVRGRGARALVEAILATVLSIVGVGAHRVANHATCYIMAPLFPHRTPQMVRGQRGLLARYRERDVINDETYRKSLEALDNPLGLKPQAKKDKQ